MLNLKSQNRKLACMNVTMPSKWWFSRTTYIRAHPWTDNGPELQLELLWCSTYPISHVVANPLVKIAYFTFQALSAV